MIFLVVKIFEENKNHLTFYKKKSSNLKHQHGNRLKKVNYIIHKVFLKFDNYRVIIIIFLSWKKRNVTR